MRKKPKEQTQEPVEFVKKFKEIEVRVKNKTKVSQYFYDAFRDLHECKPGRSITYIERLETVYVPANTEKKQ